MIEPKQLEHWASLYDRGFQSFDGDSNEARGARIDFFQQVKEAYKAQVPSGSISFSDFRREAIKRVLALLKERRPPSA
jgi:hypothetical protein